MKKRNPWFKIVLFGFLALLIIGGGIYWYIATDKFQATKDRESAYTVTALDFIHAFELNNEAANKKYTNEIITVNGTVSEIEAADSSMNIKFTDTTSGSYIIFAFQKQYLAEAKMVKQGDNVSIKGACSGGIFSRLRKATAINFQRSTLYKP